MSRYTIPTAVALAVTLHLAGCDKSPSTSQPGVKVSETSAVAPSSPAGAPTATASLAVTEAPLTATTPEIADKLPGPTDRDPTNALAYWRAAMERHDWIAARRVFGDFGAQSGMTPQAFVKAWDKYRIVDVTLGSGEQDGAAGSTFYDVPVTIAGLTTANKPYNLAGRLTLRRVNDVDGASAEQLRWHIERSTLRP
jgi:hypothetical protein